MANTTQTHTPYQARALRARRIERDAVTFAHDIGLHPRRQQGSYSAQHDMLLAAESVEVSIGDSYLDAFLAITKYVSAQGGNIRRTWKVRDEMWTFFTFGKRGILLWKCDGLNGVDLLQR